MIEVLIEEVKGLHTLIKLLEANLVEQRTEHDSLAELKKRTGDEQNRMKFLNGSMTSTIYAIQGRKKDLAEKKEQLFEAIVGA